jgi:hypothetical protein
MDMACIADRAAWRSEIFRPDVADISLGDLTSASSGAASGPVALTETTPAGKFPLPASASTCWMTFSESA